MRRVSWIVGENSRSLGLFPLWGKTKPKWRVAFFAKRTKALQVLQIGNQSLVGFWCLFPTSWLSLNRLRCWFASKKTPNNAVMPKRSIISFTSTMSTVKLYGVTSLFGIFLETNKHHTFLWDLGGSVSRPWPTVFGFLGPNRASQYCWYHGTKMHLYNSIFSIHFSFFSIC